MNLFRIEEIIDTYPEYIRLYSHPSTPAISVSNLWILNNTFIDLNNWTMKRREQKERRRRKKGGLKLKRKLVGWKV